MRHARSDYNRIQDPAVEDRSLLAKGSTPIAVDEPVFLLRGQDAAAPAVVRAWADLNDALGGDPRASNAARAQAEAMVEWQAVHGSKRADLPEGVFTAPPRL